MDAEKFTEWLDAAGLLTPDQRRRTFMVLALGDAEGNSDGPAIEAAVVAGDPAMIFASACGDEASQEVTRAAPLAADAMADALTAVARGRVASLGCPHCDGVNVRPWGCASGLPRWRCQDCRRTFNALTGTSLAGLRHKDRWSDQARALMSGESVAKAAARCGVADTAAFRWRHRFLAAPALDQPTRLHGIVEADATFILES